MSFFFNQPDPKRRRFPIPNGVWKWELKPQGFAILAYLCYLHVHCNKNALPSADEIASQLHMSKDMAVKQIAEEADCRTQPSRTAGSAHGSDTQKQRQELFLSAQ